MLSPPPPIYSIPAAKCETCFRWKQPIRGRTCANDRTYRYRVQGSTKGTYSTAKGTPASYHCTDYVADIAPRCSSCVYWLDSTLKRRKDVCSKINSLDNARKQVRTPDSVGCKHYTPIRPAAWSEDHTLTISDRDSNVTPVHRLDLVTRSKASAIFIADGPNTGVLLRWGGAQSPQWTLVPISVRREVNSHIPHHPWDEHQVCDHEPVTERRRPARIRFSGPFRYLSQEIKSRRPSTREISTTVFGIVVRAIGTTGRNVEVAKRAAVLTKSAKRIEDEIWGTVWSDLKEQVATLLSMGQPLPKAVVAVSRSFGEENKVNVGDVRRLQRQLVSAHKGKSKGLRKRKRKVSKKGK